MAYDPLTQTPSSSPAIRKKGSKGFISLDFKGRKLEQLTEIAEKGYIERNDAYYTISTGGKLLPDCKKSDVKISRFSLST